LCAAGTARTCADAMPDWLGSHLDAPSHERRQRQIQDPQRSVKVRMLTGWVCPPGRIRTCGTRFRNRWHALPAIRLRARLLVGRLPAGRGSATRPRAHRPASARSARSGQVGGGEHPAFGHQPPQTPVVAHLPCHLTLRRCQPGTPGPTPSAASGSSRPHRRSLATSDIGTVRMPTLGVHPVPICHEWNTIAHLNEYEGDPEARPFTREELQRFLDFADCRRHRGRRGRQRSPSRDGSRLGAAGFSWSRATISPAG
jgi:hypothetical protein